MTTEKVEEIVKVDTLVFEGGGVKGIVYVGALNMLESYMQRNLRRSFLSQVKIVAGTSAGAIVALLVALNFDMNMINTIMSSTPYSTFQDSGIIFLDNTVHKLARALRRGYLCEGEAFLKYVQNTILQKYAKIDNVNITFQELYEKTKKELHIYAVRLNDGKVITFNPKTTPKVPIALAVRCSMSIPVYFKPVCVKEFIANDLLHIELANPEHRDPQQQGTVYYVDGGIKVNYPYDILMEQNSLRHEQMLGFKVDSTAEFQATPPQSSKFAIFPAAVPLNGGISIQMLGPLFNVFSSAQEDAYYQNPQQQARTIRIHDGDISAVNFNLSVAEVQNLNKEGIKATQRFLGVPEDGLTQEKPNAVMGGIFRAAATAAVNTISAVPMLDGREQPIMSISSAFFEIVGPALKDQAEEIHNTTIEVFAAFDQQVVGREDALESLDNLENDMENTKAQADKLDAEAAENNFNFKEYSGLIRKIAETQSKMIAEFKAVHQI